jgi:proline iminopeptidase
MRNSFSLLLLFYFCSTFGQQTLYSRSFGDKKNPAIIFLHGGPGYNCASFEFSTAQVLADKGFYVVVFDQRGCGRSPKDSTAKYSFTEAFADLNMIYRKYAIETAMLIGHSWGGTLGIMFAKEYPQKVKSLVLTGSPISYQRTFKSILARCRKILAAKDSSRIKYIEIVEKMDTNTLSYSGMCFMHAMSNGLYSVRQPSEKSKIINDSLKKRKEASLMAKMTSEPVSGFYENEKYITLDLTESLKKIKSNQTRLFGLYGAEDGLFDEAHLTLLRNVTGSENFELVSSASHNVFIDQQEEFIRLIIKFSAR